MSHQNSLRPTLGHPQQQDTLEELQKTEEERHQLYLEGVRQQTEQLQVGVDSIWFVAPYGVGDLGEHWFKSMACHLSVSCPNKDLHANDYQS